MSDACSRFPDAAGLDWNGPLGKPILRVEDERFLVGKGRYVDDIELPGAAYAAFVRSPEAHARVRNIDCTHARTLPGVLAVLTGREWNASVGTRLPCLHRIHSSNGEPMREALRPVFAHERACHVGDVVALIVAESKTIALDAAEEISVDYEPLAAVVEPARALESSAPRIHPGVPANLAYDWSIGDRDAVEAALRDAEHVTRLVLVNNRVFHFPLEPRALIAHHDAARDHYTLWSATQIPHLLRRFLAEDSLGVEEHRLRVVAPDVGGGFGQKSVHYPEEAALLWASREVGRPVRWTATRGESFLGDVHGRDQVATVTAGFDARGKMLALDVDTLANLGAYLSTFGPAVPSLYSGPSLSQMYAIPAIHARVRAVYTNTAPTDAYRGAGRPEATYIVERTIEAAAFELSLDPLVVRERNLIPSSSFPFRTAVGLVYDSGDYQGLLVKLREVARYDALRSEQRGLREAGVLVGIGVGAYIQSATGGPSRAEGEAGSRVGAWDVASIRVHPRGRVTIGCGTHSHGQGHETCYRQVAAQRLGCRMEDIEIVFGDTDRVHAGVGTFYSRSITVVGNAIVRAADRIIAKGAQLAAHLLECAPADIEYAQGCYTIAGTDRSIPFGDVAGAAWSGHRYPDGFELGLEETVYYDPSGVTTAAGMHLAVVIVDRETGEVQLRDYYAVDDCGRVVNPMVVSGQIQGGAAQGIGQALLEHSVYRTDDGQLIAGSLMDYCLPRAGDLCDFVDTRLESPAPGNELGIKGVGEAGAVGAPAAVTNAVLDALRPLGVRHVDMPCSPRRVWEAIRAAGG